MKLALEHPFNFVRHLRFLCFALGLYALCLMPATACSEWSKEIVPVHAPITRLEDLDHVNVLFTEIVSRFVAMKSAEGEQNYADQR